MSVYFVTNDGHDLWNPANIAASLFCDQAESVARLVRVETGLGPVQSDEVVITANQFIRFANAFAGFFLTLGIDSTGRALCKDCFGIVGALAAKLGATPPNDAALIMLLESGRGIVG